MPSTTSQFLPVDSAIVPIEVFLAPQVEPGLLENRPIVRERPQRAVAVAEARNLQALLDGPMKGNLGRKPLFPLPPRIPSHLDGLIRIPFQNLRQARRICFG